MNFQINHVVQALLGSDNNERAQAQKIVNQLPINFFNQGIDALLSTLNNQNMQISSMGALLLKKKYLDDKQNFSKISAQKMQLIVKSVQNSMGIEKPLMFLKRCCDILVKIHVQLDKRRQLIYLIQTLSGNDTQSIKLTLMYLIEMICQSAFDDKLLMEYSGALQQIFQKGMQDQQNVVRVASFKTLTIFLSSIEDPNLVKKFEGVLELLLQKAIELIKYDQQSGIIAVQSINELVETHPKFIKPIFNQMLMIYTQIMQATGLLTNLRIISMHGVFVLSEKHPSLMRKNQYFKTNMVPSYMKMLSEASKESQQQWGEQLNEQIISKNDISKSTQQHISQMVMNLGNKFMLPLFIPYITQALMSNQASAQHAGLIAMAVLTQQCHQSFKKELPNVMNLITPLMQSTNPKIIYDTLIALGYMSEQFCPDIQNNYGDMILQFICKALNHKYPKVRYIAVKCIQNFETGLKDHPQIKIMEKFLDSILESLGKIFQASFSKLNCFMLQAVLDTLSTIASMNSFSKYYSTFMPGLKKTISMMSDDSAQKIMTKSKTIETVGYLLASVKETKELFLPDCKDIMESLINMTNSLQKDDPIHKAIFIVYQNVVQCLKQDFAVYSDHVFPKALEAATKKIDFAILDQTETEKTNKKNNYFKIKIDMKLDGLKNLVLNTDHIEQKMEGANLLECMAEDMGSAFGPYIQKTIPVVAQLIVFKHNKQIRGNMIRICKHILNDCVNEEQKSFVLNSVLPPLLQDLSIVIRQKDNEQMNEIIEVLSQMMPTMTLQMKNKLPEILLTVLTAVKNLTKDVQKEYADKQMDQTMQDQMDENIQSVQQCLPDIQKMISVGATIPEINQKFIELKKYFPKQYEFQSN